MMEKLWAAKKKKSYGFLVGFFERSDIGFFPLLFRTWQKKRSLARLIRVFACILEFGNVNDHKFIGLALVFYLCQLINC
jgi:hypothetical protein